MEHHEIARGIQAQEQSGRDATKDIQGVAKQVKTLDLKVARLERLVEDLRHRVELLEYATP